MTTGWQLLIGWAAFVMLSAIVLGVWGYRTGQFKKIERPKYRMLEDHEPEPWPKRRGGDDRRDPPDADSERRE